MTPGEAEEDFQVSCRIVPATGPTALSGRLQRPNRVLRKSDSLATACEMSPLVGDMTQQLELSQLLEHACDAGRPHPKGVGDGAGRGAARPALEQVDRLEVVLYLGAQLLHLELRRRNLGLPKSYLGSPAMSTRP